MKKFLTLVLAVVLCFGMTTVAFANLRTSSGTTSGTAAPSSGTSIFGSGSGSYSGGSFGSALVIADEVKDISRTVGVGAAQAAVNNARSSGKDTANARFRGFSAITGEVLRAMNNEAPSSISLTMSNDTMIGEELTGRLTIYTDRAAELSGEILLGVYVDNGRTTNTRTKFSNWFTNQVQVINLEQKGSYGMWVRIAAKTDLSVFTSTDNLYFYSYDRSTNDYTLNTNPSYTIDSNGYIYFNTYYAGEVVISNGPLVLREATTETATES